MDLELVSILHTIAETLARIEQNTRPAGAPAQEPTLLEAIARTYGNAQAAEVAAQIEIARAEAETAANGTAKKPRKAPRYWSIEFPEMAEMLARWNYNTAKSDKFRARLETETDATVRLFLQMEIERADELGRQARSEYDRNVKAKSKASRRQSQN
jgi:hypothetical protein